VRSAEHVSESKRCATAVTIIVERGRPPSASVDRDEGKAPSREHV